MKKHDALEHAQRARELDPLSMVIGANLGHILLYTREYDRSIETLRETLELYPSFATAQSFLARAYTAKGMHKEAVEVSERRARTDPESFGRMVGLAEAYAGAGRREDALRILEEVRVSAVDSMDVAYVYAALGDADAAFEWLERAYEERDFLLSFFLTNPVFARLHSDPRFQDLLRRMNYPGAF